MSGSAAPGLGALPDRQHRVEQRRRGAASASVTRAWAASVLRTGNGLGIRLTGDNQTGFGDTGSGAATWGCLTDFRQHQVLQHQGPGSTRVCSLKRCTGIGNGGSERYRALCREFNGSAAPVDYCSTNGRQRGRTPAGRLQPA